MNYIDPHIHMISRVTDDYHRMAQCGCVAISEPAFWAGFDRGSAEGFRDYFRHLTEVEPKRAAQFGIRHYSWVGIGSVWSRFRRDMDPDTGGPHRRPEKWPASLYPKRAGWNN